MEEQVERFLNDLATFSFAVPICGEMLYICWISWVLGNINTIGDTIFACFMVCTVYTVGNNVEVLFSPEDFFQNVLVSRPI